MDSLLVHLLVAVNDHVGVVGIFFLLLLMTSSSAWSVVNHSCFPDAVLLLLVIWSGVDHSCFSGVVSVVGSI
jgi:hypothetical protein